MGAFPGRHRNLMRIALYLYVVLAACPIRYWPLESGIDETWRFALNYARAQGLTPGIDTVFTSGPLGYLIFPQHIGGNLALALLFQAGLWLALAAIFADVFFRAVFPLRNLALFSFCFGLAAPLFWFDYLGLENLMLSGALILIVMFHFFGSWTRYLSALALVGLLPFFKLTAAMIGITALAGYLVERVIRGRWKALPVAMLTAVVPAAVAGTVCLWVMPSAGAVMNYLSGSAELISGFSAALSMAGPGIDMVSALEAITVFGILLWLQAGDNASTARFYVLLLALPLFVSFKHGFVRHDGEHATNLFCFVALSLALVSLTLKLDAKTVRKVAPLVIIFVIIWQDNVVRPKPRSALAQSSGAQAARMLWGALHFNHLQQRLDSSVAEYPEASRIEPELVNLIGDSPVASLSSNFTNLAAAHMRLKIYPVVQRYAAFTPYLDGLNAAWIRDKGPRFLVFDGQSIDDRDPWAETPAMWLEIYRWYGVRLLGSRNLLLERRATPRFTALETISRFRLAFPGELRLQVSRDAVFWTMKCGHSIRGRLQKLLFRVPGVFMSVHETGGVTRSARIIPEVLVSPVMGNYLPGDLEQFAAVFQSDNDQGYSVDQLVFESSGAASYSRTCEVELLRPVIAATSAAATSAHAPAGTKSNR